MGGLICQGKRNCIARKLDRFFDICEKRHYILGDITSANLVYQDQNGGNFICIDGTGEKALIPVHEWFCWANEWKLKRSRARIEAISRNTWLDKRRVRSAFCVRRNFSLAHLDRSVQAIRTTIADTSDPTPAGCFFLHRLFPGPASS